MIFKKCCDNCKYYYWYGDLCKKFECYTDERAVCNSWEPREKDSKEV